MHCARCRPPWDFIKRTHEICCRGLESGWIGAVQGRCGCNTCISHGEDTVAASSELVTHSPCYVRGSSLALFSFTKIRISPQLTRGADLHRSPGRVGPFACPAKPALCCRIFLVSQRPWAMVRRRTHGGCQAQGTMPRQGHRLAHLASFSKPRGQERLPDASENLRRRPFQSAAQP